MLKVSFFSAGFVCVTTRNKAGYRRRPSRFMILAWLRAAHTGRTDGA